MFCFVFYGLLITFLTLDLAQPYRLGSTQPARPGHWPTLVTWLAEVACMRELFTCALHSAQVQSKLKIQSGEEMKLTGFRWCWRRRWWQRCNGCPMLLSSPLLLFFVHFSLVLFFLSLIFFFCFILFSLSLFVLLSLCFSFCQFLVLSLVLSFSVCVCFCVFFSPLNGLSLAFIKQENAPLFVLQRAHWSLFEEK